MILLTIALLQAAPATTEDPLAREPKPIIAPPRVDAVPMRARPLPVPPPPPPPPPPAPTMAKSPIPAGNLRRWVTTLDYPKLSILFAEEGIVNVRLNLTMSGRVSACTVLRPSGFARLDELTCKLLSRRAKFTPALGPDGQPAAGRYTQAVGWKMADEKPVRASSLGWKRPADAKRRNERGTVSFKLEIDENGNVATCSITESSGYQSLDDATCRQLKEMKAPSPFQNERGKFVSRKVTSAVRW